MTDWVQWLKALPDGDRAAMVTILACEGSAPRGVGTRMVVTPAALLGTIGGGQLEYRLVEQARAILDHAPGSWRIQDYPLGPLLGQCCGGRVRVLVEHVDLADRDWLSAVEDGQMLVTRLGDSRVHRAVSGDAVASTLAARGPLPGEGTSFVERIGAYRRPVYLFGAGHVGQAIARHAASLPIALAWFDTRAEYAGEDGVTTVTPEDIASCIAEAPDDAAVLILTHDHGLDYRLTVAALTRSEIAFVGVIGSATKRARFMKRLTDDGVPAIAQARLHCPIGLPGISGKEPDVIAVATLAQILSLKAPT